MMRPTVVALLVLFAGWNSAAQAKDAPMLPGLWAMDIQGTTHVAPNLNVPMQRNIKICVKPGQKPETVVVPTDGQQCTSSHTTLPDGQTQWTFHCDLPQAKVTQTGTFHTEPTTFDSHWTITSVIPSGMTTTTTTQVTGKRLGEDCGSLK